MGSSDHDHAVRQLNDLRCALFSSLPERSSSLHQINDVPVGLVPFVFAVAAATRSVVKEWISKRAVASNKFNQKAWSAQFGPVAQRAQATPQPIGSLRGSSSVSACLESGGMNPFGDVIATNTWWCAASYLQSLGAQWGFTPGCRRPGGVDIQLLLPEFPFAVDGQPSTGFDSIALWCAPA